MDAVGNPRGILLLGGTSEIGLAICRGWLERSPARVVVAARDSSPHLRGALESLTAAGASSVEHIGFDAADTDSHPAVIDRAFAGADIDVVVVAFGLLGDAEALWHDQALAVEEAQTNFTGAVSVGVLVAEKLQAQGHGQIVALSSVAGVRVRRSNFVYGATKAGFDGFFVNLGEALRGTGVRVLVVRPGQVATKMVAGRAPAPLTVTAEAVASDVVRAVDKRKSLLWTPAAFRWVMAVLSHVPQPLMRYLPF